MGDISFWYGGAKVRFGKPFSNSKKASPKLVKSIRGISLPLGGSLWKFCGVSKIGNRKPSKNGTSRISNCSKIVLLECDDPLFYL